MIYVLAAVVFFFLQNVVNKEFTARFKSTLPGLALFDGIALSLAAITLMFFGGAAALPTDQLILAAAFGVLFVITVFLIVITMSKGPMGMSSLLINMSMIIPVTGGILIWGEELTIIKFVGILCMVAVLALSGLSERGKGKNSNLRWFALAILTMVFNGTLSLMQKALTANFENPNATAFNCWAFAIGGVLCWLIVLALKLKGTSFADWTSRPKELLLCSLGMGWGTVGGNMFNVLALTVLPAVVAFPLVQGTVILSVMVGSMVLYKEKLSKWGILALVLGIAGIIFLSQ